MNFDPAWNDLHARKAWGQYPNEHLVRFVKQTEWPENKTALDLGCGAGAQSRFLAIEGFTVHAVDGSKEAIRRISYVPERSHLCPEVDDVVTMSPMRRGYDLVVDVCTLQHLPLEDAATVIVNVHRWLKPDGWFFSIMASDQFIMVCDIPPRMVGGADLMLLLRPFDKLRLGHELTSRPGGGVVAHWIVEAQK